MKIISTINRTRGALKRFTLGLAVSAAVVFGTGLTANAQIIYDFAATDPVDPVASLQGWTQIYRTPVTPDNSLWGMIPAEWGWMPDDGHLGEGWEEIDTLLGRSPEFTLTGSGDLTFQLIGSKSPLAAPDVAPSAIPEIAITNGGFMGVALRDVAADTYVLSKGLSADNYSSVWTDLSFTALDLQPYTNNGKLYTLDFIDYSKRGPGGSGWIILAGASIPGVLFYPANDNFANAINLPGPTGTQTGTDNVHATLEVGEPATVTYPDNSTSSFTNTVWFKWTCPENGDLTVSTLGSTDTTLPAPGEYDAVLGIYTGASVDALTPLGPSPLDTGVPETMTVAVTAGTTNHIQVAGWNSSVAANILLNWTFVPAIRAEIESFGPGATISPVVTNAATIAWTVPYGSDLATLAPTFTLSPGATCTVGVIPVNSGDTVDFSAGPVDYIVTSSNLAITNVYTVTVTVPPPFVLPSPPPVTNGMVVWLPADGVDPIDTTQVRVAGSNTFVKQWNDLSVNANNATQTTEAAQPKYIASGVGGQPVIRFNNASSVTTADLSAQFPDAATVFIVTTINNDNAYTLVKANPGVDEWWRYDGNGRSYPGVFRGNRLEAYCAMPNTGSHLFAVSSSASAWEMAINGVSQGVAGANYNASGAPLVIGNGSSGGGLNGDIAEVLIYSRVLTATEADQVGSYLATKYGLATTYGPPTVVNYTPPDESTTSPGADLVVTFNEPIAIGTGNLTLTNLTDSTQTVIAITDATQVSISGAVLTINPTSDLVIGKNYAVQIDAGAIKDLGDAPFAGILDNTTWNFTTAAATTTATTLISSINPSTYGDSVTFTATVAPPPSGGTVQFKNGVDALGTPVAVAAGVATYSTTTLNAGTNGITAEYSGNFQFAGSTSAVLTQVVNKAGLTVTALNMLRLPNTANPEFVYSVTGFKNGQNLGTSGVTGTPTLTTDAVLASPVGTYDIICALGSLAAANYSFTFVKGTLTVAVVADTFSVNFYGYGALPTAEAKANVLVPAGVPAGFGDWYNSGWANIVVPWNPSSPQPTVTLASSSGLSAKFVLVTCRNGGPYLWATPRTTLLGDGNGNMMDGHVNSTLDASEWFDMEVSEIPFAVYDVIFYMGANQAQFGDGTGNIVFNGGDVRAFTLKPGAFDGTFIEMVDATTQGNYIVFKGVTGSTFTTRTWGNGFNHIGPFGFQIREAAPGTLAITSITGPDLSGTFTINATSDHSVKVVLLKSTDVTTPLASWGEESAIVYGPATSFSIPVIPNSLEPQAFYKLKVVP